MNSFFGVDPAGIQDLKDLGTLLNIVSSEHGRFIYDYPKKWRELVNQRLGDLTEIKRKQVVDLLERQEVRATFQPPPDDRRFENHLSWEQNALRLRGPVVLMGLASAKLPIHSMWDLLANPAEMPDSGSDYVPMKPGDLVNAVTPLLMVSTKVVLIDPYLKVASPLKNGGWGPSSSGTPVLKELLRQASRGRVEVFEVYSSSKRNGGMADDQDGAGAQSVLENVRNQLNLKNLIEVKCKVLEMCGVDKPLDDHDRHLLGNHCGISSGRGFSVHDTLETKLQWLRGAALKKLLDDFMVCNPSIAR